MSNESEDSAIRDVNEIDPGEPIAALAAFENVASSRLLVRIRHAIQRRRTVGQLASFSVNVPLVLLREFWSILTNRPDPTGIQKETNYGEKPF
jgi:hypothetical protein